MKVKLDENLGRRVAGLLREAGHDAVTTQAQGLSSSTDRSLLGACRAEGRCLITPDLDFGNPLLFRPKVYAGIAVLRLPPKPTPGHLTILTRTLIGGLARGTIESKLWIVEPGRIREYQEPEGEAARE